MIARWMLAVALLAAGFAGSGAARADTLDTVRQTKVIKLGFRMDAKPLSFLDPDGNAAGYAVDICRRVADALKASLGLDGLTIDYVPVSAENRIQMLLDGNVDIECATTTRTLERQERVDFSLLTFVTGADLLVRGGSRIGDVADLAGKKVGVLAGTTTEVLLRRLLKERAIEAEVETVERHEYGIASLETDQIDAYFADRVLLQGLMQRGNRSSGLKLSGKLYSFEPYALMVRRGDGGLRLIADRTIAGLYRSGEIEAIYGAWFGGAKPGPVLRSLYTLQAIPEN